jgi:hypothetical protein
LWKTQTHVENPNNNEMVIMRVMWEAFSIYRGGGGATK